MLEHIVEITEAYDKRNPDPAKNYGVHGVNLKFLVKGPKGVIQFLIYTNWMLPHNMEELKAKCDGHYCYLEPMPADIGYHSYVPMHEGEAPISKSCEYLEGKPCYYDGSSLNAEPIFDIMVSRGGDAMWAELERWYHDTFDCPENV